MKKLIEFIKATAIGGLVVIVPVTIILAVLSSLVTALIDFANLLEPHLPFGWLTNTVVVAGLALATIILLCFGTGLFLLTGPGKSIGAWLDKNVAQRIPLYAMLKNLTAQFAGIKGEQFQVVEADLYSSGVTVLGFLMERLPDGRLCVFVPSVPMATIGQLYYMTPEQVRLLDTKMVDAVNAITQWGVGSDLVFKEKGAEKQAEKPGSTTDN